jgi:hypothetical protein
MARDPSLGSATSSTIESSTTFRRHRGPQTRWEVRTRLAQRGEFLMHKTKLFLSTVLACATALFGPTLLGSAPAASASTYGPYVLKNVLTGKCLDVPGGIKDRGVRVQQWDCWGGDMQKWITP